MKFIVFLLLFLCSMTASAQIPVEGDLFADWLMQLEDETYSYEQTKTQPDVTDTFKASGIFQFVKDKGIIFKQEKPAKQTFVSTTEKYCLKDVNGQTEKVDNLSELPHFSDIKKLFDKALDGKLSGLKRIFEVFYIEEEGSWLLRLTPKSKDLASLIMEVTVTGSQKPEELTILYTNGEEITVHFTPSKQDISDEIGC